MLTRLRTRWFATGGALLLVLALGGVAMGADRADESGGTSDQDGATALVIVTPAGCDVATDDQAESDDTDGDDAEADESEVDEDDQGEDCDEQHGEEPGAPDAETDGDDTAKADVPCVEVPAPVYDPTLFSGFGAYVSAVAQSDAIGGKNCNHGGAVSEAVKAAKAEAKAAHDAAKAAAKADREAAKAERAAARSAAKATRDAAKAERNANRTKPGKGNDNGH